MRLRRRPERTALLIWLALAAMVTPACTKAKDASVGIKSVQSDIVFGVKEQPKDATPDVAPQSPSEAQQDTFPGAFFGEPPKKRTVPLRVEVDCPAAAQNAFPAEEAPLNISKLPVEGSYKFKKGGTATFTGVKGEFPISGFEQRLLRRAAKIQTNPESQADSLEYTFEVVEPRSGNRGAVVTQYLVRTSARQASRDQGSGVPYVRQGDPERGVTIKRIDVIDAKGNNEGQFAPATGLLVLPLPIVAGEQFQSAAVDPKSGQSLTFSGKVVRKQQVDACGEVADSWRVEGALSGSATQGPTGDYVVNFATQWGGLPIYEKYSKTDVSGTSKLEFGLAKIAPEPLPAEAK